MRHGKVPCSQKLERFQEDRCPSLEKINSLRAMQAHRVDAVISEKNERKTQERQRGGYKPPCPVQFVYKKLNRHQTPELNPPDSVGNSGQISIFTTVFEANTLAGTCKLKNKHWD